MDRRQFRSCACSRDTACPSRWTVATAAATLRGLHDAGLLEVAYGGGEPFAFRGFADLVAELDTTTLAQHVTTNGTRIADAMWFKVPERSWRRGPDVRVTTATPAPVLATIAAHVTALGANLSPWIRDLDPLGAAIHRLI